MSEDTQALTAAAENGEVREESGRERPLADPPRLDIQVGGNVLVEIEGPRRSFKSRFLGWDAGRFVLLGFPSRPEIRDQLYQDRGLILRFLHCDGTLYGFHTSVGALLYKPERLLFARWPESVETLSLRKEDRVNCFLRADLQREGGARLSGRILNISPSGCRFILTSVPEPAPAVGEELTLVTRLFACASDQTIRGTVRTLRQDEGRLFLGLEFADIPKEATADIGNYIEEVRATLGLGCEL